MDMGVADGTPSQSPAAVNVASLPAAMLERVATDVERDVASR